MFEQVLWRRAKAHQSKFKIFLPLQRRLYGAYTFSINLAQRTERTGGRGKERERKKECAMERAWVNVNWYVLRTPVSVSVRMIDQKNFHFALFFARQSHTYFLPFFLAYRNRDTDSILLLLNHRFRLVQIFRRHTNDETHSRIRHNCIQNRMESCWTNKSEFGHLKNDTQKKRISIQRPKTSKYFDILDRLLVYSAKS